MVPLYGLALRYMAIKALLEKRTLPYAGTGQGTCLRPSSCCNAHRYYLQDLPLERKMDIKVQPRICSTCKWLRSAMAIDRC